VHDEVGDDAGWPIC